MILTKPELYIPLWVAIIYGIAPLWNTILQFMLHQKMGTVVQRIEEVETNVNSKMDRLVKVTGESEHAKGVLQEKTRQGEDIK